MGSRSDNNNNHILTQPNHKQSNSEPTKHELNSPLTFTNNYQTSQACYIYKEKKEKKKESKKAIVFV